MAKNHDGWPAAEMASKAAASLALSPVFTPGSTTSSFARPVSPLNLTATAAALTTAAYEPRRRRRSRMLGRTPALSPVSSGDQTPARRTVAGGGAMAEVVAGAGRPTAMAGQPFRRLIAQAINHHSKRAFHAAAKSYGAAAELLTDAADAGSETARATAICLAGQADARTRSGATAKALVSAVEATVLWPEYAGGWEERAHAEAGLRSYANAIESYERALSAPEPLAELDAVRTRANLRHCRLQLAPPYIIPRSVRMPADSGVRSFPATIWDPEENEPAVEKQEPKKDFSSGIDRQQEKYRSPERKRK